MRRLLPAAAALGMLLASACASNEPVPPVMLNSEFAPQFGRYPWAEAPKTKTPISCRVSIGEVVDARSDKQSMGSFGGRYVRHDDTVGWLRSGLDAFAHDKRLQFVGTAGAGDHLVVNVSLLKAYMEGLATSKNSTVVLQVRYTRNGAMLLEKTFRGDHTDVNWSSGDGEARDSLNRSLQEALVSVHADLASRCSKLLEPQVVAAS